MFTFDGSGAHDEQDLAEAFDQKEPTVDELVEMEQEQDGMSVDFDFDDEDDDEEGFLFEGDFDFE